MKRVWNYVVTMWQPASAFVLISLVTGVLFSYHLGSLVPGAAQVEINTRNSSQSIKTILDNPINAPYKTAQFAAKHIHKSIAVERLISGLIAGTTVVFFYYIVRRFSGTYAAIVATILFGTSSSLLLGGRLASAQISVLLLFVLCVCGYRLRFHRHRIRNWLISTVVLALALYTPSLIYFVIAGAIWQFRAVKKSKDNPSLLQTALFATLFIALLLPLILGFTHTPELWHEYFGIPAKLPNLVSIIKNILAVPAGIVVFAPKNPLYRLGRQPVLDAFTAVLFIVGCYSLTVRYKLDRFILIAGIIIIAVLYTAISGDYENSLILLPFIYLLIGIGITYLLQEWNKVFPNNPLARWLAMGVMTLAVIVSCNFQTRRYFIAWPNNVNTRAVFSLK